MTRARAIFTRATEGHPSWRLPVDQPPAEADAAIGAPAAQHERTTEMSTQGQSANQHLMAARQLLDEVSAETDGPDGGPQAKATAAAAHAILVLAEQVAAARLTLTSGAMSQQQQREATS